MRILHVINSLAIGGAQSVLAQNLEHWPDPSDRQMVISLQGPGPLSQRIEALGMPTAHMGINRLPNLPFRLIQLARAIHLFQPDIVQTWLYHSDLLGSMATRMASHAPIVWGVHHTLGHARAVKASTLRVVKLLKRLSTRLPARIICCADSAYESHRAAGYALQKMSIVHNGVDTNQFRPDEGARLDVRRELGLPAEARLIGMFARFHAQKDHETLLQAIGLLARGLPDVHFVLAGKGVDSANPKLQNWIQSSAGQERVHLLGLRHDVSRLIAAMDITTLSSAYGEALPVVLCESMACGVPCVATDVGDCAQIIGATGRVVLVENPSALANAWADLLTLSKTDYNRLSLQARERIQKNYNVKKTAQNYRLIYADIIAQQGIP